MTSINLTQLRANTEAIRQGSERHNDDSPSINRLRETLGRYTT